MGLFTSNNEKERIDRKGSTRRGTDRFRTLRKRETDAKVWDRLPANGICVEPENAA